MSPSKTDTWRTILLKIRTVRLFTPKKKKQYADLYKEDQAAYPQKNRKKKKKKKKTLKPKP